MLRHLKIPPVTPMQSLFIKAFLAVFVVLLGAVFFWQPIKATFSGVSITNDFVLQTADGTLDTKSLRGKVLAIVFGYANCDAPCTNHVAETAKAYDMLNAGERSQVRMILVSVDPERDTSAGIKEYASRIHPEIIGATGKPEEIKAVADAFSVDYQKYQPQGGSGYAIAVRPLTYIVDADGRFVSVLNETLPVEKTAAALRARLPATLPPGK